MRRFVYVAKARKPPGPPPKDGGEEWRSVHGSSEGTSPTVSVNFIDATQKIADEITPQMVEQLIRVGALDRIVDSEIDWAHLELLLSKGIKPELIRAIKAAADAASPYTASIIKDSIGIMPDLTFNATNPRLARWINTHTAEFVKQATVESRQGIKSVIGRLMSEDLPSNEVFRAIRRTIGLTDRMAIAAQNVFTRGINEGLDRDEAMREADAYAQRSLNYRASMIAQTETIRAANQGQQEGWQQAAEQGYFNPDEGEVEWVVTPDDRLCPTCEPMDGERRPLNGVWRVTLRNSKGVPVGLVEIDNPTDVHPLCRCAQRLVLPS